MTAEIFIRYNTCKIDLPPLGYLIEIIGALRCVGDD
jgi:hypothetical protein